jgi:hypothetical protein
LRTYGDEEQIGNNKTEAQTETSEYRKGLEHKPNQNEDWNDRNKQKESKENYSKKERP